MAMIQRMMLSMSCLRFVQNGHDGRVYGHVRPPRARRRAEGEDDPSPGPAPTRSAARYSVSPQRTRSRLCPVRAGLFFVAHTAPSTSPGPHARPSSTSRASGVSRPVTGRAAVQQAAGLLRRDEGAFLRQLLHAEGAQPPLGRKQGRPQGAVCRFA